MDHFFRGRGRSLHRRRRAKLGAAVLECLESRRMLAADLVISEFLASNDTSIVDSFGNHEDWLEIHNAGDADANLNDYFLTDNSGNPEKWRFPVQSLVAGDTLVVFASERNLAVAGQELHTNFKLAGEGEYLALIRAADDSVQFEYAPTYPSQSADISYGLADSNDPNSARGYFSVPTPGALNAASAASVTFSVPGKTFSVSQGVSLSTTTPGATIYYTTNNAAPTTASTVYAGPITLTGSKIVRAIAVAPGLVNSPITSQSYTAVDSTVNAFRSNLPIVVLESFNTTFTDATAVNASATFIDTQVDGYADMLDPVNFTGRVGLRYRGSTSYSNYPKKPFAVEVRDENNGDRNASILGMPADSDWVLYSPWTERSLMNNALAMDWARQMGHYASRIRFVEVYLNNDADTAVNYTDDYLGVYILMEKPKIDSNRVDINEVSPSATTEPDITGGYFFKKDRWEDRTAPAIDEIKIDTLGGPEVDWQRFVMVEPDEFTMTSPQLTYLTNYLNELDAVIQGASFADPVNGYAKYLDVDSWVDFWIMNEFTKNVDGFWLSTFYYKPQGGKIHMGPVWDFNLAFGQVNYRDGASASGYNHESLGVSASFGDQYGYFGRLFDDPNFQTKVTDRWQELRKTVFNTPKMLAEMDAHVALLTDNNGNYPVGINPSQSPANPASRNFKKWPVLGVYGTTSAYFDPQGRWIEDVNMMKNWVKARAEWMDTQFPPAPVLSPLGGDFGSSTPITITPKTALTGTDTSILTPGAAARANIATANITGWQNLGYTVPAGWLSGTTGVGYDTTTSPVNYNPLVGLNVGAMQNTLNNKRSVFIRVPFTVANPATVDHLILKMKYDDGFVAWVNGVRVIEGGVADNLNPVFSSASNAERVDTAALQYVEWDISEVKSQLVAGTNVLAIQGMNFISNSDDFLIMPEIVSRTYSSASTGNVYYTTDGSDPRNSDDTVNPAATLYTGAFNLSASTRVRARRFEGGIWSGIADEVYNFDANTLRITEFMYNPPAAPVGSPFTAQDFEFIEVQNTGASTLNLHGLHFSDGVTFTFPDETLAPGEYGVVVKNIGAFQLRYGTSRRVLGFYSANLDNGSENVAISDGLNVELHSFTYDDDWYPTTDGQGRSLVILNPTNSDLLSWNLAASWRASFGLRGAPGASDEADSTAPTFQSANFDAGAKTVSFTFSEPVSYASPSGLTITELITNTTITPTSAGAAGNVASFVLPTSLADGVYRVMLPIGGVMDMSTNPLANAAAYAFLYVASGNTLALANGSPTYVVNQLAIGNGATFDMGENDLIVRNGNFSTVSNLVTSGFGNFDWLGTGITSSSAAAFAQSDGSRALGVIDNAEWGHATFGGETVSNTDILVKFTWVADSNLDGLVDNDDFGQFLYGYNGGGAPTWLNGDFDHNGVVDNDDFGWFLTGMGAFNASGGMQL